MRYNEIHMKIGILILFCLLVGCTLPPQESVKTSTVSDDDFVESVICAYKGKVGCQDQTVSLSEFTHCPKEEFGKQGAIEVGSINLGLPGGVPGYETKTLKNTMLYLLKIGCDIDKKNVNGLTPLHSAVIMSSAEAVDFLIGHGADPYKKISKAKNPTNRNYFLGLNVFDLVKRQHTKDLVINGIISGDKNIYRTIQQKYPSELAELPEKKKITRVSSKYTATKFGYASLKKSALDPDFFLYAVIGNENYDIGNKKTEAVHFIWFSKSEVAKKFCTEGYKVLNRIVFQDNINQAVRYVIDCSL